MHHCFIILTTNHLSCQQPSSPSDNVRFHPINHFNHNYKKNYDDDADEDVNDNDDDDDDGEDDDDGDL